MQNIYDFIETPLFVINSQYDSLILQQTVLIQCMPSDCSDEEIAAIERYNTDFDRQAEPIFSSPSQNGYFIDSCFIHCQTIEDNTAWSRVTIDGITMAQAVGDWYYERSIATNTRLQDCNEVSCNPTCPEAEGDADGTIKIGGSPYLIALVTYLVITLLWK